MTERKSNLGKILKGISTKKDSEKPSVVEVINRACEKGVTSTGAFSLRNKETIKTSSPFIRF